MFAAITTLGWIILVLLLVLLILELVGVTKKREGDTITEVFRTIREKLANIWTPLGYLWTWIVVGLLAWTIGHFLLGWL